jgi:hypothetical protein
MTRDGREGSIAINLLHGLCDFAHSSSQFATTDQLVSEFVLALTSPWPTKGATSKPFVKDVSLSWLAFSTLTSLWKQLYQTPNFVTGVPSRI